MSLLVRHPGTYSIVVDGGRVHTSGLGVPPGGPADRSAAMLANALVGNSADSAALEITLSGPTIEAERPCLVAVFGAPFSVRVDDRTIPAGTTAAVRAGQVIRIGGCEGGCRGYLAVHGGLATPKILGSRCGFQPISEGDRLPIGDRTSPADVRGGGRSFVDCRAAVVLEEPGDQNVLRCVAGPQADWFREVLTGTYAVSSASNRMGLRLEGPPVVVPKKELRSEPVSPGAIQITNEGKPIVLGVEGQTIGGYPKIAHIIRADLDRVGRLRPGGAVRFEMVDLETAAALWIDHRRRLDDIIRRSKSF